MRHRQYVLAVVVVVLTSTTGCGRFASSDSDGGSAAASTTTARYGSGVTTRDAVTTTAPGDDATNESGTGRTASTAASLGTATSAPKGDVDIRVVGPTGVPRSGIPVRFTGPVTRTVTTDGEGHARASLTPGRYRAAPVEGCVGQLVIRRGSGADVGVADGDTARGELVAEVGPRFLPAAPVSYSGDAPWRPGEVHVVTMRLEDACGATRPPSPAAYLAARFVANPAAEVVAPLSAEVTEDGMVEVALRCGGAEEDVTLDLVDVADGAEKAAVLIPALMTEQSRPFCIN